MASRLPRLAALCSQAARATSRATGPDAELGRSAIQASISDQRRHFASGMHTCCSENALHSSTCQSHRSLSEVIDFVLSRTPRRRRVRRTHSAQTGDLAHRRWQRHGRTDVVSACCMPCYVLQVVRHLAACSGTPEGHGAVHNSQVLGDVPVLQRF